MTSRYEMFFRMNHTSRNHGLSLTENDGIPEFVEIEIIMNGDSVLLCNATLIAHLDAFQCGKCFLFVTKENVHLW